MPKVPIMPALGCICWLIIPQNQAPSIPMHEELPMEVVRHIPVLADEVMELLDPQPGQIVVDGTTGVGGHALLLAGKLGPTGRLICLDRDPEMLALAGRTLGVRLASADVQTLNVTVHPSPGTPGEGSERLPLNEEKTVTLVHGNFEDLPRILQNLQMDRVDAVLADLGFCSDQMADPSRGLSFQQDGPLDMRLDRSHGEPASAMVQRLRENELADIFWLYGEERFSRRVARKIVEVRKTAPLTTTGQLADLVRSCVPRGRQRHPIDPATRVFQALRIAVNDELGALERLLNVLPECLKPGGKAAIISFHSLEDRLVKRAFRQREIFEELTRKPRIAAASEICHNPRARSAKLRVARIPMMGPSRPGQ
jgi:16S rRNA (cytosine1402-N4)-methyltransferase